MSFIKTLLSNLFLESYFKPKTRISKCFLLIGFTDRQLQAIEKNTVHSVEQLNKNARVVDVENLALKEIIDVINKRYAPTLRESYENLLQTFEKENTVFIIKNISKAKTDGRPGHLVKELVEMLDYTYQKSFEAKADLIVLDHASFLEENWDIISNYVIYNYPSNFENSSHSLTEYAEIFRN